MQASPLSKDEFARSLQLETSRVNHGGGQLGLIVFGLDDVADLRERLGDHVSDALHDHLAAHLAHRVRSRDRLGRLPGDEFALLVPGMELSEVTGCAVKLRHLVSEFRFNLTGRIFASFGVTHFQRGESAETLEIRARRALAGARAAGGNRVSAARADL